MKRSTVSCTRCSASFRRCLHSGASKLKVTGLLFAMTQSIRISSRQAQSEIISYS